MNKKHYQNFHQSHEFTPQESSNLIDDLCEYVRMGPNTWNEDKLFVHEESSTPTSYFERLSLDLLMGVLAKSQTKGAILIIFLYLLFDRNCLFAPEIVIDHFIDIVENGYINDDSHDEYMKMNQIYYQQGLGIPLYYYRYYHEHER